MNKEQIAVLVDSCCDVPKKLVEQYGMYVIPLKIIYKNKEYLDGVNITAEDVYRGLDQEVPKTSLPSGELITEIFDSIKAAGYTKVIVITLSSGLSGTNNMLNLMSAHYEGLDFFLLDTKNIAIGAGFHAIQAARYIDKGLAFDEIKEKLRKGVSKCKIFFVVSTLEYLQKGGRIGLVASLFGNALNLKPIISCNEDGIYYTVNKVRGRKQSITKTIELALTYAQGHAHYNIAIANGDAKEEAEQIKQQILPKLSNIDIFVEGQVSPALGVHTGPGAIGIAVQILDEDE